MAKPGRRLVGAPGAAPTVLHHEPGARLGWWAAAAAALGFLLYVNALGGPFLYDDVVELRDNERIHSLGNIPALLASDFWDAGQGRNPLYRPVTAVVMALLYAAGGGAPWVHHLFNLLLHAAGSALCVLVLGALTGRRIVAAAGGLLFAAHPVHTEAVAWISGLAEPLSAAFVLGAWLAHLKGRPVLSVLLLGGGLFSKEGAVVFPALAVAGDLLAGRPWRSRVRSYAAFAAGVGVYLAVRLAVLGHLFGGLTEGPPLLNPLRDASALERVLTSVVVTGRAMVQSLAPTSLCLDYGFDQIPVVRGPADLRWLASLAALVLLAGAVFAAGRLGGRRLRAEVALGAILFGVSFLPASNLLFPAISIFAERNLYLPVMGFCLILAALGSGRRGGRMFAGAAILAVLVVAGAAKTLARNREFSGPLELYGAATASCPRSARVHLFLGIALREHGRVDEAARAQLAALSIAPDYADARAELGLCRMLQGDLAAAEKEFREALEDDPLDREARSNLAAVLAETGRKPEALRESRTAVQLHPGDPEVLNNLGSALIDLDRMAEARDLFGRLEKDYPSSPHGPNGLGTLSAREGDWPAAASRFEEALRRKPGDVNALFNLATAWQRLGRSDEALSMLEKALASGTRDEGLEMLRDRIRQGARPAP